MFAQSILAIAAATLKLPGALPSQLMTAGVTGANVSGLTSNAKVQSEWLPQCTETFTPCRPMRLTAGLVNVTGHRLPATVIEYRFALPVGSFAYSLPKSSVLAPMGICDSLKMSRKRTGL